ncbi:MULTISPECIES: 6-carboxytetrahydropterin synthase [Lactiplantibacillus]|jgi:6-pyruvoyltetrahydropterin/6-carboxytetrahydropterin synthase|uniref:6-carboxy-5,6,7,8-tetrahydropterin synthase n=2 Tax=Lactiplantibacillus pentosus TaxID=1589 RepID=A0AAP5PV15_LACPE|nr:MULTISPECIES: 6-carboxytetrahydropterin synthase [Lactiplantibacillus]EQM54648.1 6-pyruvoyl-tetrahydropterin synthase [Lactiplantibacillus plantarum EGD-AQ4]CCC17034.1 6-pyruvoyl tetrahydropterin synthase [Lactiplantibacillus pentosus IG1]EIW15116.1 6-pyruvoyl-tetrahydropterin synthase family protein [Lactiplantibacillus pentosus KCA1]MBQ0837322.1 6-carboxytetrahydropterin synthase [Lactiplantibacillus pentosus]MBU7449201.1 6-carboxytetrahydropterin synthase [Lactiplantibacillus sp. 7.2.4]
MTTKQRSYKIKSYVNASHAIRWATGSGKKHTHTWEIVCELHTVDAMVAFYDIEKNLHQALDELSGKFLNDLPEFKTVNPTVENVTEYLFKKIDNTLRENGAQLMRIEVSDSPTRAYCISVTD